MAFNSEPNRARDEATALAGRVVMDTRLASVGTVTDVIFDERAGAPRWAVVKTGLFRSEHLVPLEGSYLDRAGRLVVALDKTDVKRSPHVRRDHVLTSGARLELRDFYGVAA
jgi:sporulation protein YlmC with PRC-barrel domain